MPKRTETTMSPCKGCTQRYRACHGHCAAYIDWKEGLLAAKHHLDSERRVDAYTKHQCDHNRAIARQMKGRIPH